MMPRPKIVTWSSCVALSTATACEHVAQAAGLIAELADRRLVDDRQLNLEADAIDGQQQQREQDLLPQLGNLQTTRSFSHIVSIRPC